GHRGDQAPPRAWGVARGPADAGRPPLDEDPGAPPPQAARGSDLRPPPHPTRPGRLPRPLRRRASGAWVGDTDRHARGAIAGAPASITPDAGGRTDHRRMVPWPPGARPPPPAGGAGGSSGGTAR